jgi:hypothetical protein
LSTALLEKRCTDFRCESALSVLGTDPEDEYKEVGISYCMSNCLSRKLRTLFKMTFAGYLLRQVFVHPPQIPSNVSLEGQTILITGATSGIGLEAARQCVRMKAKIVILAVRSISKGEAAKEDILGSNPGATTKVEVWVLDLESFDSVLAFGERASKLPCE